MGIVQVIIDRTTSMTIEGTYEFDRADGGTLVAPSGTAFPLTPVAGEWFWRTDEQILYRRGASTWDAIHAVAAPHAASHGEGQSDAVTVAQSQVTNLVSDLAEKLGGAHITVDEHPCLSRVMSTGLMSGGQITVNGTDPGKFDIAEALGVFVDCFTDPDVPVRNGVVLDALVGVTPLYIATGDETYLYFNSSGVLVQRPDLITDTERRDLIYVGYVSHLDNTTIDSCVMEPFTSLDVKGALYDFLESFGSFNVNGNEYTPSDGNLHLQRSAGKTFDSCANFDFSRKSPNLILTDAVNPCEVVYYYRDINGEWVNNSTPTTNIDPDQYDTGLGLASVPSGKWTIQPIMFYARWETTDVQYGQTVYDTQAEARSALQAPVVLNPYNADWDTFRGWLIVKQGATDLSDPTEAEFIPAGKLGLVSTSSGGSGGEVNTASNIGTAGVGLYDSKLGVDLRFKKVNAGSAKVTVTDDTTNHEVDLDVATGTTSSTVCVGDDARLSNARTPTAHATTHKSGGSDSIKLDELAAPTDITTLDVSTTAHGLTPKLPNDSAKYLNGVGAWAAAGSVVGNDFQSEVQEATATTTSSTMQTRVTLTTPALTGTYRIDWQAELQTSASNTRHQSRLYNNADAVELGYDDHRPTLSNMYKLVSGFAYVTFTGAAKTFLLQFASQGGSATVTIRRARMDIKRVS